MHSRSIARLFSMMAVALLAACGGSDGGSTGPNPAPQGFTATVTGDVEASVKGDAAFGHVTDPDIGQAFAIELVENDGANSGGVIQLIRVGAWNPAVGTYAVSDAINGNPGAGDWIAVAADTDENTGDLLALFVSTGGTVKITSVAGNVVKGTFNFGAAGGLLADPNTTLNVNVSGSFVAREFTGFSLRAPALRVR